MITLTVQAFDRLCSIITACWRWIVEAWKEFVHGFLYDEDDDPF